jgi:hypothetical protein
MISLRSLGSVMITALAGSSTVSDSFRQNKNPGLVLRLASQSRCARGLFLPSASGVPHMIIRPPILWNHISVFRGSPVFAPMVTMSMVRSLLKAAFISSFIGKTPYRGQISHPPRFFPCIIKSMVWLQKNSLCRHRGWLGVRYALASELMPLPWQILS